MRVIGEGLQESLRNAKHLLQCFLAYKNDGSPLKMPPSIILQKSNVAPRLTCDSPSDILSPTCYLLTCCWSVSFETKWLSAGPCNCIWLLSSFSLIFRLCYLQRLSLLRWRPICRYSQIVNHFCSVSAGRFHKRQNRRARDRRCVSDGDKIALLSRSLFESGRIDLHHHNISFASLHDSCPKTNILTRYR
jgi:hypothetical protein